ncbi:glycosyltransferase [Thermopirellula anaerolimosa]
MRRILHVIHSIDPRSGGPSHALRGLVQEQVRRGHHVTILTTDAQSAEPWAPEGEYRARMQADPAFSGSEIFIAHGFGRSRIFARYTWTPEGRRWLARRLRDQAVQPDVLHIHGVFSHLTTLTPRLARRFGVPYVMRPAGTFSPRCLALGRTSLKRWFTRLFVHQDLKSSSAVQATTPAEADELRRQFSLDNVRVIPHGVALPSSASGDVRSARHELGVPGDAKLVLYLSRITPKKRVSWVIEAVGRLSEQWPDLVGIVAGPDAGAERELRDATAAARLNGRIRRYGFATGELKARLFQAADVLVLPSQSENFGVVVVEAMAHGVPVVVTPGVASHIYVDASGCGMTVEDSIDGVTEGIRRLLQADKSELGRRGREYVEKHLTWPAVAKQVDDLYESVLRPCRKEKARANKPLGACPT